MLCDTHMSTLKLLVDLAVEYVMQCYTNNGPTVVPLWPIAQHLKLMFFAVAEIFCDVWGVRFKDLQISVSHEWSVWSGIELWAPLKLIPPSCMSSIDQYWRTHFESIDIKCQCCCCPRGSVSKGLFYYRSAALYGKQWDWSPSKGTAANHPTAWFGHHDCQ